MSKTPSSTTSQSKVTLQIGSKKLSGFGGLQIVKAIDSAADAYSFSIPWNPDVDDNLKWFKPFNPQIVKVRLDDEIFLTGYIEKHDFSSNAAARTLDIQGRSASGAILDWSAGPPFQFEETTFNNFTKALYQEYYSDATRGVAKASTDTDSIGEINIDIGQTHYEIISKLASAHGLWAVPDESGTITYKSISSTQASVATLEEGKGPVRSVSASYDITKRFQQYMVIGTYEGQDASSTVTDPETFGIAIRGRQITELSQQTTDIDTAAKFARSKAIIDAFSASIQVDGWHYNGSLWEPGTILSLYAPGAFIIRKYARLMIKRVTYQIDESGGQFATLDLSLPEAWDNSEVDAEALPWVD